MELIFKKLALIGDVWVLWILVVASILSIGVMVERWWAFRKNKINFPQFYAKLTSLLESKNSKGLHQFIAENSSVESRLVQTGLKNWSKGPAPVEKAMTSRLVIEKAALEKYLVILGTLGNNAPFIGLFGTVLGIIKAFHDLAISGNSGVSVVMEGISSALIATAFGILVAIPAVMANNYFQTKLKETVANGQSLIHMLQVYLQDKSPSGPQTKTYRGSEKTSKVGV